MSVTAQSLLVLVVIFAWIVISRWVLPRAGVVT